MYIYIIPLYFIHVHINMHNYMVVLLHEEHMDGKHSNPCIYNCIFMKVKVKMKSLSRVRLFTTLWTVAHQASPSMEFSRQEYWGGLPVLSPGDLPNPGIEPRSPALQADTLTSEPPGKPIVFISYRF